ncbi:NACHT domain-containing protein [Actinosynnema sp. NPDC059335]|uniref:NACHT domain-containing protein n=1 Tax=Actinosynnema sp. NPDC059335 TaxID=3346804 RepID=UPI003670BD51
MRNSSFTYRDAVALLGGDTGLVRLLDRSSAAAVLAIGGIDLLDARTEVVRLGAELLSSVRERVTGLHRVDRTRLLEAAHSVLVITAFFEAVDEIGLPFDLKLGKSEQLVLAGADRPRSNRKADLAEALFSTRIPLPSAEQPPDAIIGDLAVLYGSLADELIDFLDGFQAWHDLPASEREEFVTTVEGGMSARAARHYRSRYRQLALDCPEFAVWTTGIEHAATRAEVRTGLADLRAFLERLGGAQPPDERRESLARTNRAVLDRPIVAGDVPTDLVLPTLGRAYVPPLFKVVDADRGDDVSQDAWWSHRPVRVDLDDYLAGFLTSSAATTGPLVVLGQPGAGKSLLTKVLAARLPAADFVPIRVALRDVPADASLQEQVEHAITEATGEHLTWPDLARAVRPAVPVVLLDGFDELLQATGASRSDYLARIAEFQDREAVQGRAVIFIVTSRTAVANRARFAGPTKVLKLEPFGDEQVRRWLDVWNEANPRAVLDRDVALRFPDLAGQPLLLFMLALFNADGNALHAHGADLAKATLYEELLVRFARREVVKSLPGALAAQVDRAVEDELVRLSVVAFAMFNRGAQWIDETGLDDDLNALLPGSHDGRDRNRLSSAQLAVGRFFYVHAARAAHDGRVSQTYEFLHATFGEYLVARLVHRVARQVLAEERAAMSPYGRRATGTGWLEPVLSFAPLTTRTPVVSFLRELFDATPETDRAELYSLFTGLVHTAQHRPPGSAHPDYTPRALPIAARIAAYTVNLVLLAVVVRGDLTSAALSRAEWRDLTLLWQSQLSEEEWDSVTRVLAVEQTEEVSVVLREGESTARVDLAWLLEFYSVGFDGSTYTVPTLADEVRRWETFRASWRGGYLVHVLEPLMEEFAFGALVAHRGKVLSLAHLLLIALTSADPEKRRHAYRTVLVGDHGRYSTVLLKALAADSAATVALLEHALDVSARADLVINCALRLVRMTGGNHRKAVLALDDLLMTPAVRRDHPHVVVEALTTLIDLSAGSNLTMTSIVLRFVPSVLRDLDLDAIAHTDPYLYLRLERALESIGEDIHMAR